jgi:hypothetical protein
MTELLGKNPSHQTGLSKALDEKGSTNVRIRIVHLPSKFILQKGNIPSPKRVIFHFFNLFGR